MVYDWYQIVNGIEKNHTQCLSRFISPRFVKHHLLLNDGCQRKEKLPLKQILIVFTTNILLQQKMSCLTTQVWLQVTFDILILRSLKFKIKCISLNKIRLCAYFFYSFRYTRDDERTSEQIGCKNWLNNWIHHRNNGKIEGI